MKNFNADAARALASSRRLQGLDDVLAQMQKAAEDGKLGCTVYRPPAVIHPKDIAVELRERGFHVNLDTVSNLKFEITWGGGEDKKGVFDNA